MTEHEPMRISGKPGHWQRQYREDLQQEKIPRDSDEDYTGWKVDVEWLKEQITLHEEKSGEEFKYIVFVVTRRRDLPLEKFRKMPIIDPTRHRLWIRAFNSPTESMAEDFPPIQWP